MWATAGKLLCRGSKGIGGLSAAGPRPPAAGQEEVNDQVGNQPEAAFSVAVWARRVWEWKLDNWHDYYDLICRRRFCCLVSKMMIWFNRHSSGVLNAFWWLGSICTVNNDRHKAGEIDRQQEIPLESNRNIVVERVGSISETVWDLFDTHSRKSLVGSFNERRVHQSSRATFGENYSLTELTLWTIKGDIWLMRLYFVLTAFLQDSPCSEDLVCCRRT